MKTTTYIYANGVTTVTVSDKPALTPARYAQACRTLNIAALAKKSRRDAVDILRDAAVKTQFYPAANTSEPTA